jgi:ketosteroid isomerase-like protein
VRVRDRPDPHRQELRPQRGWAVLLLVLMRRWLGCVFFLSCASARDATTAERSINAMLDDWHEAAAHADEVRYFDHFASDGVFLGTDATERWDIAAFRAYAHPRFASGRAWSFHAVERHVHVRDDRLAWFDERLATERLGPARGSGVVARGSDGVWRIEQYNLALTIPNERFDAVRRALASPP